MLKTVALLLTEMSNLVIFISILLNVLFFLSSAEFRFLPEHIFTMDVALICQVGHERLKLNALVSIWEADISEVIFNIQLIQL